MNRFKIIIFASLIISTVFGLSLHGVLINSALCDGQLVGVLSVDDLAELKRNLSLTSDFINIGFFTSLIINVYYWSEPKTNTSTIFEVNFNLKDDIND